MAIGLSTYAFFWRASSRVPNPLGLEAMLEQTAESGAGVFQICDYAAVEALSSAELEKLRQRAVDLGIQLELGTRGLATDHLTRYLTMARALDVRFIRTMFNTATHKPTQDEALALLRRVLPEFEQHNIQLGLETYEQVRTRDVLAVVDAIDSPALGICLDPGNCVAALEYPREVIELTASRVVNLHIKDFAFARQEGWVGFTYSGCLLGTGLLDYDALHQIVRPNERNINQIVEHWLPWQANAEETCRLEDAWTRHSLNYLYTRNPYANRSSHIL
ncbi:MULTISPECIES: sugar phosphate isomerase/epimerase [Pectobacterium]|uniref:sugar phosphate isomerase/epimerase family protein n=1 Tax=Pectobacterium TaxID=122277 RepID=UPI00057CE8F7|nr:sugar phosphate isomerase/epimerase family protein [Pectobacterium brasiliense]KHS78556.1 sugar phosphate isomerase [Pectobacterium brasiliense]KHT42799.1 sugar phosphate isomerase [Pectobacterium brasiliense]MBN3122004.1 sugar phosphate isomerase/epimerase [Pectobacterium brasiliense]MBN3207864.1 sugar phosphate isomerase/epimerase [Pectobacterium brasiliense]MDY4335519.1 sugar phosphate isomerase/epimerase family protein [Pectobacterium brasiliense]